MKTDQTYVAMVSRGTKRAHVIWVVDEDSIPNHLKLYADLSPAQTEGLTEGIAAAVERWRFDILGPVEALIEIEKIVSSFPPSPSADAVTEALRAYLTAQRRMLDRWADGDENVKRELWRNLHACEDAADAALAARTGKGDSDGR